jgi:hypothetical protein
MAFGTMGTHGLRPSLEKDQARFGATPQTADQAEPIMRASNIHYEMAEKARDGQLRGHRRDLSDDQQTGIATRDRLTPASTKETPSLS